MRAQGDPVLRFHPEEDQAKAFAVAERLGGLVKAHEAMPALKAHGGDVDKAAEHIQKVDLNGKGPVGVKLPRVPNILPTDRARVVPNNNENSIYKKNRKRSGSGEMGPRCTAKLDEMHVAGTLGAQVDQRRRAEEAEGVAARRPQPAPAARTSAAPKRRRVGGGGANDGPPVIDFGNSSAEACRDSMTKRPPDSQTARPTSRRGGAAPKAPKARAPAAGNDLQALQPEQRALLEGSHAFKLADAHAAYRAAGNDLQALQPEQRALLEGDLAFRRMQKAAYAVVITDAQARSEGGVRCHFWRANEASGDPVGNVRFPCGHVKTEVKLYKRMQCTRCRKQYMLRKPWVPSD